MTSVVLLDMKKNWIAIDWGTTNFRAFLLREGEHIESINQACGLLSVEKQQFAPTLQNLLRQWLLRYGPLPIVMAGMVGSQQGWHDVPYTPLPCGVGELLSRTLAFVTPWGSPAWIVPGVRGMSPYGLPDVMRGEEVQLLGLAALHPAGGHTVLLPGTHSKHVLMVNERIAASSTFMTGELFSLLSQYSILGKALPEQRESKHAFVHGVATAQCGAPFTHQIFSARTFRLTGDIPETAIRSYISGLLIGYELLSLPEQEQSWVIGSPSLTERYQLASGQMNRNLFAVNGDDCFVSGLDLIFTLL
ncbi:2-dehydro-3-deoxygalactonokinase [Sodalis sp. RH21]|uniref:2-dehydro-3-deoxygalactonokinase n=1 Tax=unclassified Sodalis (in: enterobacteria) TaxID=2636512 RepID=UPI0039B3C2C7